MSEPSEAALRAVAAGFRYAISCADEDEVDNAVHLAKCVDDPEWRRAWARGKACPESFEEVIFFNDSAESDACWEFFKDQQEVSEGGINLLAFTASGARHAILEGLKLLAEKRGADK